MKFCGATIIAACLAGNAIAMPTMKGPMFNNKQMELIEMINNNRANIPMDQKTTEMLDGLVDIVRWQQAGMPGDAVSDVAAADPTAALGDGTSAASGLLGGAVPTAVSGVLGGAGSAVSGLLGGAASAAPTGALAARGAKPQQSATSSSAAAEPTGAGLDMPAEEAGDDAAALAARAPPAGGPAGAIPSAAGAVPSAAGAVPSAAGTASSAASGVAAPATSVASGATGAAGGATGGLGDILKGIPLVGDTLSKIFGGGKGADAAGGAAKGATDAAGGAVGNAAKGATGAAGMAKRFSGVVGQEIGI